jgi:hypothetical protein
MDVRYAETRRRGHRVLIDDGRPFVMERCNLDDARLGRLTETPPNKPHWLP